MGKHDIEVIPQINSCVVHWARNELLTKRRPDAHVLFCDDDIVVERDTLDRLLSHKKDIVAALCTRRIDPPEPVIARWNEQIQNYEHVLEWKRGQLIEVDSVGTGLILISPRVLQDVAMAYHKQEHETFLGNGFWFEFLKGPQGNEWGEDVSFCWKARRLGFRVYVDTSINPGHVGEWPYGVNDYLCYQNEVLKVGGIEPFREALKKKAKWAPDPADLKVRE